MNPFSSALRDFWHTMTSNDRHSTHDSPHRTGRHVPLGGRNSIMTGVATASDSRADINSPYFDDSAHPDGPNGIPGPTPYTPTSPSNGGPYSPGLRSMAARNASQGDGFETQSNPGDVPMQPFKDGIAPAPPAAHSWRKIDAWAEEHYPELFDQLCEGATTNDLNDLEHQLDCSLPQDVRESLMAHDGQERGGRPTGIIFGSMLMDCEEIVQEWETWRRVNQEYLLEMSRKPTAVPSRAYTGSSEASSSRQAPSPARSNPDEWRQALLDKQACVPPNSVQKAYAHIGWIPLVRDWGGNNLAVDVAPGPGGTWGQIVLFGRDYDTKYVVARSWGAFLALVADDLNSGKWYVDEETNELKLREFKETRVEPAYFSILRWRMDQKHGRRAANKRRSTAQGKQASPLGSRSASPYASPVETNGDVRGRSMQRLSGSSPLTSPMRQGGHARVPLALSRVTEEMAVGSEIESANIDPSTLVEVDEPREVRNGKLPEVSTLVRSESDLLNKENEAPKANGRPPKPEVTDEAEDAMRTIEI